MNVDLTGLPAEVELARSRERSAGSPRGWEPGIRWDSTNHGEIISPGLTEALADPDEGWSGILTKLGLDADVFAVVPPVEVKYDPAAWHRDGQGEDAVTRPVWRYKARVVRKGSVADPGAGDNDIERLADSIMSWRAPKKESPGGEYCMWVDLADWQIGKADGRGTEAIVARVLDMIDEVSRRITALRKIGYGIGRLHVQGMGDLFEGCDNHYCVTPSTRVLTGDLRWVAAGDLSSGDSLYAFEEEGSGPRGRRFAPATVLSHEIKMLPTVIVELENGDQLTSTPEHPWLVQNLSGRDRGTYQWVQAQDLTDNHVIARPFEPWTFDASRDAGWLAGMFDGEGHLAGGRDRSAPNILVVSQKSGVVHDRLLRLLEERGYQYTNDLRDSGVNAVRILGGIPEIYRLLGSIRPERLLAKVGFPYVRLDGSRKIRVVSTRKGLDQPIAVMGTSSKTFIADGYMAHNSMQTFQVELDRREQTRVIRRLILKAITTWAKRVPWVTVGCVPGNHGENRKGGKAFTTFGDNDDVAVFEQVAEIVQANPALEHVEFTIPDQQLIQVFDLAGTVSAFIHAHQATGSKQRQPGRSLPGAQAKVLSWWEAQAFQMSHPGVADAHVLHSAHYHHFSAIAHGANRLHLQCPAMDDGSIWFENMTGITSMPGTLTGLAYAGSVEALEIVGG